MLPINARSFIHVTMVHLRHPNEAQVRGAYDTCKLLVTEAAKHGYGEYRAHLDFMDLAAEQFSFGDNVQRRFNETIKDALDPNGILAPGKRESGRPRSRRRRPARCLQHTGWGSGALCPAMGAPAQRRLHAPAAGGHAPPSTAIV